MQRSLVTSDIPGASPHALYKLKRKKIFVDKNEIKGVFGQTPGAYHGFANDYVNCFISKY